MIGGLKNNLKLIRITSFSHWALPSIKRGYNHLHLLSEGNGLFLPIVIYLGDRVFRGDNIDDFLKGEKLLDMILLLKSSSSSLHAISSEFNGILRGKKSQRGEEPFEPGKDKRPREHNLKGSSPGKQASREGGA